MYRDDEQREFARRLRREATGPERLLWRLLRERPWGCKFRRQAPIGPYFADFACFSPRMVIELDGVQHAEGAAPAYDSQRTAYMESQGFLVVRFWNHELDDGAALAMERIGAAVEAALAREKAKGGASPNIVRSLPLDGEG